jgi:hypothetical protein
MLNDRVRDSSVAWRYPASPATTRIRELEERIAVLERENRELLSIDSSIPVRHGACGCHATCHQCGTLLLSVAVRRSSGWPLRVVAALDCPEHHGLERPAGT